MNLLVFAAEDAGSDLADAGADGDDVDPGCDDSFAPATRVLLASGAAIPISQLKTGDKVLATNTKTGKTRAETVKAVIVEHDIDLYDLTVKVHGRTAVIQTTSHHRFWDQTTSRWTYADALAAGDLLRTSGRATVSVVSGQAPADTVGWMWDLTIASDHDFYIDAATIAVLVHNCPTSRGSTGRTSPGGENEARAMDYVKQYPEYGDVLPVEMSDPTWSAEDGWVKMSQTIDDIEIHYVYNPETEMADDFKFKDWSQ